MRPEERGCEAMSPALAVVGCALDVCQTSGIGLTSEARCGAADNAVVFTRYRSTRMWSIGRDPDGL